MNINKPELKEALRDHTVPASPEHRPQPRVYNVPPLIKNDKVKIRK